MRARFLGWGILILCALAAPLAAAPEAVPPPEDLAGARLRQSTDWAALEARAADAVAALRKWYETALDAVKKDALSKGNLDGVLAVDTERQRIERELTPEELKQLPPLSRTARDMFDQARANQAAQGKQASMASLSKYVVTLEGLQKRLTQKGEIDAAVEVREEREGANRQLTAATFAEPAVAASAAAPATAPTPVAVPAPLATIPKPAAPAVPAAGGAISVATAIKAKGDIAGPGPGAVGFVAPDGNGRRGSRGVLLKNDPETGTKGTTWTFQYTRAGAAQVMQIIHPHRRGQVVICLRTNEPALATPRAWSEVGWGGGDAKKVRKARAAQEIFPLKENQAYTVVSELDAQGSYKLTIDGKLVATAQVTSVSALALGPGFTGAELPLQWQPGYAALLAGPIDSGINECRDIKFQVSPGP